MMDPYTALVVCFLGLLGLIAYLAALAHQQHLAELAFLAAFEDGAPPEQG